MKFFPFGFRRLSFKTNVIVLRTIEWAIVIKQVADVLYPQAEKIVTVLDNLNTHTLSAFYEILEPEEARRLVERFEFHFTPKHGSWLNMAEIEPSVLVRQCVDRHIPNIQTLIQEIQDWQQQRNDEAVKVLRQFRKRMLVQNLNTFILRSQM